MQNFLDDLHYTNSDQEVNSKISPDCVIALEIRNSPTYEYVLTFYLNLFEENCKISSPIQ